MATTDHCSCGKTDSCPQYLKTVVIPLAVGATTGEISVDFPRDTRVQGMSIRLDQAQTAPGYATITANQDGFDFVNAADIEAFDRSERSPEVDFAVKIGQQVKLTAELSAAELINNLNMIVTLWGSIADGCCDSD